MPFLYYIPHGADPQVLRQRSGRFKQNTDAAAHLNPQWRHLSWEVQFVGPFPSWLLPTYSTPSAVLLSLNNTPPAVVSLPFLPNSLPSTKHLLLAANNTQDAVSATTPLCLSQFPSASFHSFLRLLCNEDAVPDKAAATTVHPTTTTTSSSSKPLRLSSSNLPMKMFFWYDIRAPSCSINWGSRGLNIIRNPSHSASTSRTDKQDTVRMRWGRGPAFRRQQQCRQDYYGYKLSLWSACCWWSL